MRTIFKYDLRLGENGVITQEGALFRHFAQQDGQLRLWLEVDSTKESALRNYVIVGTGHKIPRYAEYRATCFAGPFPEHPFVWHLYEL